MTRKITCSLWLGAVMMLNVQITQCALEDDENIPEASGAEFLKSVMSRLQTEREQTHAGGNIQVLTDRDIAANNQHMAIMGPTPLPPLMDSKLTTTEIAMSAEKSTAAVPAGFSREELAALYKAALQKGASLQLGHLFGDSTAIKHQHNLEKLVTSQHMQPDAQSGDTVPGYYYYFYPINSFMKNVEEENVKVAPSKPDLNEMVPTAMMVVDNGSGERHVEPLFVAMAGFIGMALMFVFSVLFLPKFGGALRSRGIAALRHAPDELAALTRIVLAAVEGDSCSERVACEAGHVLGRMEPSLRIMETFLPTPVRKQLKHIRSLAGRKESCSLIPCKKHLNKIS